MSVGAVVACEAAAWSAGAEGAWDPGPSEAEAATGARGASPCGATGETPLGESCVGVLGASQRTSPRRMHPRTHRMGASHASEDECAELGPASPVVGDAAGHKLESGG